MSTDRRHVSWLLWLWWVAAGAIGGGVGGTVAAPLERTANSYTYLIVAAVVTAVLQWLILRRYIRGAAWWVLATIAGWTLGFQATAAIGFSVVSVFGLDLTPETSGVPTTILSWFPTGAIVGLMQWLVLRQRVARSGWWILVCAVGWTLFGPVLRDVGAAVAGIVTGVLGGAIGAVVVIAVVRQRLSHSGLWVLAAVIAWAVAWIAALAVSDAGWQLERDALSGVIEGAALSALPGLAMVWLLRRPIAASPDVPPFDWRFWLQWVLVSAGSAAIIGVVLGATRRAIRETPEGGLLLGYGDFVLILFTALGIAVGIIQWIPLRRRIPWASRWIVMSALGVAVAGPFTVLVGSILNNLMVIVGAAVAALAVSGAIYTAGITSVTGMALIWLLQEPRPTPEAQERA